jgi:F0F1-type ATP synthase assembly protein I
MTTGSRRGRPNNPDRQAKPYQPASPYQPPTSATPDQSQSQDQPQQEHKAREADGWQILSYMLGGMLLYGGIGWLVSRWTGIEVLFPVGMILGIGLSIAMIIFRFTRS